MGRTAPVAVAPQNNLDAMAYGDPSPAPVVAVAYAGPEPVRYDAPYHLDAGDRLRVVVYGQEGLTNTYSISAGGTITMPLLLLLFLLNVGYTIAAIPVMDRPNVANWVVTSWYMLARQGSTRTSVSFW